VFKIFLLKFLKLFTSKLGLIVQRGLKRESRKKLQKNEKIFGRTCDALNVYY
jgi:hypothetical protein